MPYYQKLGQMPSKHHIWFHRNGAAPTYKNEGIAYEHVFTTAGFDEAYSICYHLRPPTRVRNVELIRQHELKKVIFATHNHCSAIGKYRGRECEPAEQSCRP